MEDFKKELEELLSKHKVAIISRVNEFNDSEIGFQRAIAENFWSGRNYVSGYDVSNMEIKDERGKTND